MKHPISTEKMKVLFFCALMFLVGCAGGKWVYVQPSAINVIDVTNIPKNFSVGSHIIGEVRTVSVGQEITRVKLYDGKNRLTKVKEAYSQDNCSIEASYRLSKINLEINSKYRYPVVGVINHDNRLYHVMRHSPEWGILIDEKGHALTEGIYSITHYMIYFPERIRMTPVVCQFSIKDFLTQNEEINPLMSYELIYSGKNDVSLNITYREYTADDIARSSFYQLLTYQPKAKQIRFRDFVIQIHDATNEKITYSVIADGLK